MKFLMSDDLKLSAVDTEKNQFLKKELDELNDVEITHTAKTLFENVTGKNFEIEPKTLEESLNAFQKIKDDILNNGEAVKKFDLDFIKKLRRAKPSSLLQKAVYEVEKGENFDAIYESLKNEKNGALYRAIRADREHNLITVYSTRFGAWDSLDGIQIKQNETNGNKLRINFADRQATDPAKLQDVSRQNYPVATDLRHLFQKGLIQELRKDDNYIIKNIHFKKELTEEEINKFSKLQDVKKDITKEKSHTNKTNGSTKEVAAAILNNEKEIHSTAENVVIDELDKYESKRTQTIESFADKLQKDLVQKQEREKIKLEEKIKIAKNERKNAKKDAIKLLAGGMTIEETLNELSAKKYNDITVQFVVEDLKTEILESVKKEAELKSTKSDLETTKTKLEETEEKRKKIYANYTDELQRRKEIENKAKQLAIKLKEASEVISENNKIIKSQTISIAELQDEREELKEDIKNKDENIEILEAEIVEKDETIKSKDSNIISLKNTVSEKDEQIDYIEAEIVEKDETIKSQSTSIISLENTVSEKDEKIKIKTDENTKIKEENTSLESDLKATRSKLEELMKTNDETEKQLKDLREINKKMFAENLELKESLKHLKSIEEELQKYKKNATIKTDTTEKIEDVKENLRTEKNTKTFEEIMAELDEKKTTHNDLDEEEE